MKVCDANETIYILYALHFAFLLSSAEVVSTTKSTYAKIHLDNVENYRTIQIIVS